VVKPVRRADLILGLVVTAVGSYALVLAFDLSEFSASGTPGPGFFPRMISGLLVLLGVLLVVTSVRRKRGGDPDSTTPDSAVPDSAVPDSAVPVSTVPVSTVSVLATEAAAVAGATDDPPAPVFAARRQLRAGSVWLCFALCMPLLPLLGFVPAAAVLVFVLLFAIEGRRTWRSIVLAVCVPVAASVIFTTLLSLPLPQGLLGHGPLGI
jgi:putative tricarboxylic transport membrane protein